MTYASVRKQLARESEPRSEVDVRKCVAGGCPYRGSISTDGRAFLCAAHHAALPEQWPRVTEAMREHDWLVGFIDEIKAMADRHDDWREFANRFWTEDEDCRPVTREDWLPYQNRMRNELLVRCGLSKRMAPRLPRGVQPGGIGGLFRRSA